MIKINRPFLPYRLNKKNKKKLVRDFLDSNKTKAVWKRKVLIGYEETLKNMCNEKCAYCECKLTEGGNYMHIEHFYPKDIYPTSVVSWKNLLPSCGRCNGKGGKGTHNPKSEPIINPTREYPNRYLGFNLKTFQIKEINGNELGETTIKALKLNDPKRLIIIRKKLIGAIYQSIDDMYDEVNRCMSYINKDPTFTDKIKRQMEGILNYVISESKYSAILSTAILNYENFNNLRKIFETYNIWGGTMDSKYQLGSINSFEILV